MRKYLIFWNTGLIWFTEVRKAILILINEKARDTKNWFVQGQSGDYKAGFLNHRWLLFPSHYAAPTQTGLKRLVFRKGILTKVVKKNPEPLNKCISRKQAISNHIPLCTQGQRRSQIQVYIIKSFYFSLFIAPQLPELI